MTMDQPLPVQRKDLLDEIERIGKFAAAAIGVLYATGLFIQTLYFSELHVRSLELLRLNYVLVGFYYLLFLGLTAGAPNFIKDRARRITLVISLIVYLVLFDPVTAFFLRTVIERIFLSGAPQLTGNFYVNGFSWIVLETLICVIAIPVLSNNLRKIKSFPTLDERAKIYFVIGLFICITFNLALFYRIVFKQVPETMGGGKPVAVEIFLATDTPAPILEHFQGNGFPISDANHFEANLIYTTDAVIFFQETGRQVSKVYEMDRTLVRMIRYVENR
jgi:hypothetical protein